MTTLNTNGRVRKSLAEQIDRLDQILDGLAEGLNEAVAMAVKEAIGLAVKEAVQAVLTEVLTNTAIREKLGGMTPPSVPVAAPKPSLRQRFGQAGARIGQRLKTFGQAVTTLPRQAGQTLAALLRRTWQGCSALGTWVQLFRQFEMQFVTALGLGVAAGLAAYMAGPWLAAGVSALGGLASPWLVQVGHWLRRALGVSAVANV
jgi:hypothetical protein